VKRQDKEDLVAVLREALADTGSIVVAHYSGMSVADMMDFRSQMREAGGSVKVAKNTLVKIALKGTQSEGMASLLQGQTVLAYCEDPVVAPKVAVKYAKGNENLVVIGGAMGSDVLDADGVNALSSLPSLDELRGKLIGLVQAPATKTVQVLNAPAGQLARVFSAYSEKGEAA
jgi:large subunit ribosomal protein L10